MVCDGGFAISRQLVLRSIHRNEVEKRKEEAQGEHSGEHVQRPRGEGSMLIRKAVEQDIQCVLFNTTEEVVKHIPTLLQKELLG